LAQLADVRLPPTRASRLRSLKGSPDCRDAGLQTRSHEESNVHKLFAHVRGFLIGEDGPTTVEYAVLVGLVALISVISGMSASMSST
jgi:Flp pilus assembly pilin Flp